MCPLSWEPCSTELYWQEIAASSIQGFAMAFAFRGRPGATTPRVPVIPPGARPATVPVTVHWGQQQKHLPDSPNYMPGRSPLTADPEVLIQQAGTGSPVNSVPRGEPGFRERIDFGYIVGTYMPKDGGEPTPTSVGIVHYRADGSVHIVPGRPQ